MEYLGSPEREAKRFVDGVYKTECELFGHDVRHTVTRKYYDGELLEFTYDTCKRCGRSLSKTVVSRVNQAT